jgi:microcystin-dependent protein
MPTGFFMWSQTAAANATADSSVNYQEGQSPSSLNDSARGAMASLAKWRDDISGAIVTTGTSTAYTVSSYSSFDTLIHLNGQMIAFTPHATNTGTITLNVDSIGAKPLRSSPGVELPSGSLILGTPYIATYNNTDSAFYLQGGLANPYSIPLGGMIDYIWTTAPNSAFVLPYGQAISRTTYATLFSLVGTGWGVGDGTTTFNVPDLRGRVVAGPDDMGGSAAGRLAGGTGGAVLGTQTVTLSAAQLPPHTHNGSGTTGDDSPDHTHGVVVNDFSGSGIGFASGGFPGGARAVTSGGASARHNHFYSFTTDGGNGVGGAAHSNVQPTIAVNKILRVI